MDIINILQGHLEKFQTVLELGSKKGENLELLNGFYEVVASEDEKVKTRYLKDEFLDIRVILLDFIELDSHKRFDCVFSYNLYDEFRLDEMKESIENQKKLLNEGGIIFHIFDKKISKNDIESFIENSYKIVEFDSIEENNYFIAKLI